MCADNGVVCEGVTQTDSSVTSIVAKAMANGTSNINRMAQTFGADVIPVDIGMKNDVDDPNLINRKIAYGTENLAVGPAMTIEQVEKAISVGIDMVAECAEKGYNIIVTGEMGIGNTTTSSAIASVLLDIPPEFVTGRGAGLDKEGFARKLTVIHDAVRMHRPYSTNPVEIMSKLGGYDIAGMTGLFLGGAIYHIPIVIDGFISAVSGALAVGINPIAKEYMLCSHVSKEPAGKLILQHIGLKPLITAEMCLGEGTGGIMLLPMLDGTLAVYNSSHRFDELPMERYVEL
jgi:nicotinate-nucleotide--dimethylbenzimidazole phosphoribosyltransferase